MAEGAEVDLRHNAISFNEVALVGGGRGCIQHCQFWGNLHRSTLHLSEGALAASQARALLWCHRDSALPVLGQPSPLRPPPV